MKDKQARRAQFREREREPYKARCPICRTPIGGIRQMAGERLCRDCADAIAAGLDEAE